MKFPRNARIFRSQLDAAPFACVFFLLVMFILLGSLIYTPGIRVPLQLPVAGELPGTDRPSVAVAMDASGGLYYENQRVSVALLQSKLTKAVQEAREPLTLVVHMDKAATEEQLIKLAMLARQAGIQDLWLATLPRLFSDGTSTPPSLP